MLRLNIIITEHIILQLLLGNVHGGCTMERRLLMCNELCGGFGGTGSNHGMTPTRLSCRVGTASSFTDMEPFFFLQKPKSPLNRKSGHLVGRGEFVSCTLRFWRMFRNLKTFEIDNLRKVNDIHDQTVMNMLYAETNTTTSRGSPCHQLPANCWHGIWRLVKTNKTIALFDNYRTVSNAPSTDTRNGTVYDHLQHIGCNLPDMERNNLLHLAAEAGKTEMARYLLTVSKYPIDERGQHGRSPVLMAAYCGHLATVEVLIRAGGDLFLVDENHNNALHLASSGGSLDLVEFLLSRKSFFDGRRRQNRNNDDGLDRKRELRAKDDEKYVGKRRRISNATSKGYKKFDIESRDIYNRTAVMMAASFGHADVYCSLTNYHSNLFLTDILGYTTLHLAAKGGDRGIVIDLLAQNLNIESRDNKRQTPVFLAVYFQNIKVLKLLVKRNCKIKVVDEYGNNILHIAAMTDNTEVMNYVLSLGLDIESRTVLKRTPLMISARCGKVKTFEFLCRKGSNRLTEDKQGSHLIHMAAMSGDVELAGHVLLEKQNIDSRDHLGRTSIMAAARRGHIRMIEYLVNRGANFSARDFEGHNILHITANSSQTSVAAYILSKGVSIESKDNYGRTPIMVSAYYGKLITIKFFIAKGCNFQATDDNENTMLHLACKTGHLKVVKYLLSKKKMDIDSKGYKKRTCINIAAENGQEVIYDFLVDRGAYLKAIDNDGNELIHLASIGGSSHIVNDLLDRNVFHINQRGSNGQTAVMKAARYGNGGVFQLLVSRGCDLMTVDNDGNNISDMAVYGRNALIINYVMSTGPKMKTDVGNHKT